MRPLERGAIELRPAGPDDLQALYRIHREALGPWITATWDWDETDQRQRFEAAFPTRELTVLALDGVPIGFLEVHERDGELELATIEIHPDQQRRSLGTVLVGELLERGLPVVLRVLRANPARTLYERLGFRAVDETDTHVHMRAEPTSGAH